MRGTTDTRDRIVAEPEQAILHGAAVLALNEVFRASPDAMVLAGEDGQLLAVNEEFVRLTGYERGEIVGRNVFDLDLWVDAQAGPELTQALQDHHALGGLETRFRTRSGEVRVGQFSLQLIDVDGDRCVLVAGRDISDLVRTREALQASEERFRLLVDGLHDHAIFMVDAAGRIASWNRGAERLFGRAEDSVMGRPLACLYPAEAVRERIPDHQLLAASTGETVDDQGWQLRRDGSTFWADVSISTLRCRDGKLRGFSVVVGDASARKRAEEELRRAMDSLSRTSDERRLLLKRLVMAQEEERRLVAENIHDDTIQTMVSARLRLSMAQERAIDPDVARELERTGRSVEAAIGRLRTLVFELRPQELERLGLAPAIRSFLDEVTHKMGTRCVLRTRVASDPPPEIGSALFRIMQEAVTNARKHSGASRVEVALVQDRTGYALGVQDDGIGFLVEDSGGRPGHLGLISMRERAEMLGGTLRVQSAPGAGARVDVRIPLHTEGPWAAGVS